MTDQNEGKLIRDARHRAIWALRELVAYSAKRTIDKQVDNNRGIITYSGALRVEMDTSHGVHSMVCSLGIWVVSLSTPEVAAQYELNSRLNAAVEDITTRIVHSIKDLD